MEEWRVVDDYPDYEISDKGQVRKTDTKKIQRLQLNQAGFYYASLYNKETKRQRTRSVTLLVAEAFLDPPPRDTYNSVIHCDGNRRNVRASNLMWRPRWFVVKFYKQMAERKYTRGVYEVETGLTWPDLYDAASHYGVLPQGIVQGVMNEESPWPLRGVHFDWL